MTSQNRESEISYAYLHAVASAAGVACQECTRTIDDLGIDVKLQVNAKLVKSDSYYDDFALDVQLKATIAKTAFRNGYVSYPFSGIKKYDKLSVNNPSTPKILVVLFLPPNENDWVEVTSERLMIKKAAYWVSLRGAPKSENSTSQTVYLPETQPFTPQGLLDIFRYLDNNNNKLPNYPTL